MSSPPLIQCPVCKEDDEKAAFTTTPCGHSYHPECITHWLKVSHRVDCPCCRRPMFYRGCGCPIDASQLRAGVSMLGQDLDNLCPNLQSNCLGRPTANATNQDEAGDDGLMPLERQFRTSLLNRFTDEDLSRIFIWNSLAIRIQAMRPRLPSHISSPAQIINRWDFMGTWINNTIGHFTNRSRYLTDAAPLYSAEDAAALSRQLHSDIDDLYAFLDDLLDGMCALARTSVAVRELVRASIDGLREAVVQVYELQRAVSGAVAGYGPATER